MTGAQFVEQGNCSCQVGITRGRGATCAGLLSCWLLQMQTCVLIVVYSKMTFGGINGFEQMNDVSAVPLSNVSIQ